MALIHKATAYACRKHDTQFRNGNVVPYIQHPLDVVRLLANWDITDELVLAAAVCHDVLEDCPKTSDAELQEVLGSLACHWVKELTFKPKSKATASAEKAEYLAMWLTEKSVESLVIKVADRVCNTQDFLEAHDDYAIKYWWQAGSLVLAARQRIAEVRLRFSAHVAFKMLATIESLCTTLGDPGRSASKP